MIKHTANSKMKTNIEIKLQYLRDISIWKTLYVNFKYFGWKGVRKLPIFISKKVVLKMLRGDVLLNSFDRGKIKIGFRSVGIFDYQYSRTILEIYGKLKFQGSSFIGQGSKISVINNGDLTFGDNTTINANSTIICSDNILIENDCLISWDVLIMDTDFHQIITGTNSSPNKKGIHIGSHCWIGCRNTILKGTVIGANSVISCNSKLSGKYLESNCLISGNPANIIKTKINWVR